MDEERERGATPGNAFTDNRTLPNETDPATGESADDALEATRTVPEYLMPAEDASPEPVNWSGNPTQDSTQEAEWEEPFDAPTNLATGGDDQDMLAAEGSTESGIDRIVDESYFEDEENDLNDDEEAALHRVALQDDPHPGSRVPDVADGDILASDDETTRGESARR